MLISYTEEFLNYYLTHYFLIGTIVKNSLLLSGSFY